MWQNQADFFAALGRAVFGSLWQMALLWLVYQLAVLFIGKQRSAARHFLAFALLVAGFAWFVIGFFTAWSTAGSGEAPPPSLLAPVSESGFEPVLVRQLFPLLAAFYLLFLAAAIVRLTRQIHYVRKLRYEGLSRTDVEWKLFVRRWAARLGIGRNVEVWISEKIVSPATIGFLRPMILLPLSAINNLSPAQMEAVLLHELAHIRRYDYLLNLAMQWIRTFLYFNPFARLFLSAIEKERELDCDRLVMQFRYDAGTYANALLLLRQHAAMPGLSLPAAGNRGMLLFRIENMLGIRRRSYKPALGFAGVAFLAGLLLTLGSLFILPEKQPGAGLIITETGMRNTFPAPEMTNPQALPLREKRNSSFRATSEPAAPSLSTDEPELVRPVIPAALTELSLPALSAEQEQQVKKAMEESRKVLENIEWKNLEKNIADALDQREKDLVKNQLRHQLNKQNWQAWENQLRALYDQLNWENINGKLDNALQAIRRDSLANVYGKAVMELDELKRSMNEASVKSLADSDISLKNIEEVRKQLMTQLKQLRQKPRKTVSL